MIKGTDILIVDDEEDIRSLIAGILEDEGYSVRQSGHAKGAYAAVADKTPDLVILDIWLQGSTEDGIDILGKLKDAHPNLPALMISGHGTIETAVTAIKKGAYDFIEKPFKADRLLLMIERALENAALKAENKTLRAQVDGELPRDIIGQSEPAHMLRQTIAKTAKANSRVLITGEAGAGKNLIARLLHAGSERKEASLETLSCAALAPATMDQMLLSVIERTRGGTLVLDEIADLHKDVQARLVRILQDQKISQSPDHQVEFDVRILATTAHNPQQLIADSRLREDLFYRLAVVTLDVPPLRARAADISELAAHFAASLAPKCPVTFDQAAMTAMERYKWPGNVRQLKNVIEGAMILKNGADNIMIERDDLPPEVSGQSRPSTSGESDLLSIDDLTAMPLREAREYFEKKYLAAQYDRFNGSVSRMAASIGMERSALHRKLKALDISGNGGEGDEEDASVLLQTSAV